MSSREPGPSAAAASQAQAGRWATTTTEKQQDIVIADHPHEAAASEASEAQARRWSGAGGSEEQSTPAAAFELPLTKRGDVRFAREALEQRLTGAVQCDVWEPLAHASRGDGDKVTDTATGVSRSYASVAARAARVGQWLRSTCKVGSRVALLAPNCVAGIESHYAAAWAGCVLLNCNPRLSGAEMAYILQGSNCEAAIVDLAHERLLEAALNDNIRSILWTDTFLKASVKPALSTSLWFEDVAASSEEHERPLDAVNLANSAGVEMYHTSGTTGRPKGVVLSRENVVLHALGCMVEHRLSSEDVWLHAAPMFHLVDAYAMFSVAWVGGKQVTISAFNGAKVLDAISRYKITVSNLASTMVTLLLADPAMQKADTSSLQLLSCGGAPLSVETVLRAMKRFGCEFFLSYGMTECCGKISMSLVDEETRARIGPEKTVDLICTSGRPFGLLEVRVVADGADVKVGTVGEVWIRGRTMFTGYDGNPEATAEAITPDGWFRTGDLAIMNEEGYLTITDRAKDMILVGSENVYCVEVERVLHDHPGVKLATVYGLPDDAMGEKVKTCIVRSDPTLTVAQVRKHASKYLADFKVPTTVEFLAVDDLPMTGSGKVAKQQLRKRDIAALEEKRRERASLKAAPPAHLEDVYGIEWKPSSLTSSKQDEGCWLILDDGGLGCATALVTKLEAKWPRATISVLNASFKKECTEEELKRERSRIAAALDELPGEVTGVIALTALAAQGDDAHATHWVLLRLLALLQALEETTPKLIIATRGAASIEEGAVEGDWSSALAGAAVWGFARSAAAELPKLRVQIVDLCPCEPSRERDAEFVLQEAMADLGSVESAWRARRRLAPTLALKKQHASRKIFEEDAALGGVVHVISGGTGGLGVEWADRLAQAGGSKCTLVLASRREPTGQTAARLEKIRQTGARVVFEKADISVAADAARLINVAHNLCSGRVKMRVWHLAGLVDDGAIRDLTWSRFATVLKPKVDGTLNLSSALNEIDAASFVCFSSIYGLLGSRELTHYGAANAFQDGLVKMRSRAGKPSLAVSWGTWADAGMAARFGAGFEAHVKSTGMRFVPLEAGFTALASLTAGPAFHAAVLPADWAQYAKRRGASGPQPLTIGLCQQQPQEEAAMATPLLTELACLSQEKRQVRLVEEGCVIVADLLEKPLAAIDPTEAISELGLSSMHVVELANRLGEALDLEVSPTIVFECVTIAGVCASLIEELGFKREQEPGAVLPSATPLLGELASLKPQLRTVRLVRCLMEKCASLVTDGDVSQMDATEPIASLGLSSMHVVELCQFLEEEVDEEISPTLLFEHASVQGLCDYLIDDLLKQKLGSSTAKPAPLPLQRSVVVVEKPASSLKLQISTAACRLPGGVMSPAELWRDVLMAERDCVMDAVPLDRPHNGRPSAYLSADVIRGFDRVAFGISAAESAAMDPQQRLFLECSAEALEHAGRRSTPVPPGSDEGAEREIGVFAAVETSDYAFLHQRAVDEGKAEADAYCGTGWHGCVAPNRVSYLFDLRGPSVALNTACSSSLTCVSVARHSLAAGECTAALVGGANLQLQPHWSCAFVAAGMLSPTFRCRFGDDSADGYVRGEGVGVMLIERYNEAGMALLAGVGVGQDGRSNGLTAPNPRAQMAVIRQCYEAGDVQQKVSAIEAHGTGTRLGDPIELAALGGSKLGEAVLRCGSIKASIGHLEGCSGLAGLLKAALILTENSLPRSLHFKVPNAHVQWTKLRVAVVAQTEQLGSSQEAAVGTSSFGFGGALGHVALQRIIGRKQASSPSAVMTTPTLICVGAHSSASATETARRLASWATTSASGVEEISRACTRRVQVQGGLKSRPFRVAAAVPAGGGLNDLAQRLEKALAVSKEAKKKPTIALAFTGQGSAYAGMGAALYATEPVFRAHLEEVARVVSAEGLLSKSELEVCAVGGAGEDERLATALLEDAAVSQPALFAFEYALAKTLLSRLDVELVAVVGHSLGEIAAMCVAGLLTLKAAVALICGRGKAMASLKAGVGAMAAVRMAAPTLEPVLAAARRDGFDVHLAADNSPMGCTISGTGVTDALFASKHFVKIKTTKLKVQTGFHSSCVDPCLSTLRQVASQLKQESSEVALYSTLQGGKLASAVDAEYWCQQARGAVLFAPALKALAAALPEAVIVEIGPSAHLGPHIAANGLAERSLSVLRGPKRKGDEPLQLAEALAKLFELGCDLKGSMDSELALPPTAMVSPGPSWFEMSRRQKKKPKKKHKRKEVLRFEPACYSVRWEPLSKPRASGRGNVLLLRESACEASTRLAAALRRSGGQVTEMPLSASSCSVIQSFDLVIFACALTERQVVEEAEEEEEEPLPQPAGEEDKLCESSPLMMMMAPSRKQKKQRKATVVSAVVADAEVLTAQATRTAAQLQAVFRAALTAPSAQAPKRIAVVTSCSLKEAAMTRGAILGMTRSARKEAEYVGMEIRSVEIDDDDDVDLAGAELMMASRCDDVRISSNNVLARRLARSSNSEPCSLNNKLSHGAVAISGGTGSLGLIVAAHFVLKYGVKHVMLLSRSGAVRESDLSLKRELDATCKREGAVTQILRCDVSVGEDVARFAESHGAKLSGLIHAAGVAFDGALSSRTAETLRRTMEPKAGGALKLGNAVRAAANEPLALECYFSSITACVGNAGQTDYGASNAALDALASTNSAKCSLSVQWGPWGGHGMASTAKNNGGGSAAAPFIPLQRADALRCLDEALGRAFSSASCNVEAIVTFDAASLLTAADQSLNLRRFVEPILKKAPPAKKQQPIVENVEALVLEIVRTHSTTTSTLSTKTTMAELALDSLEVMAIVRDINSKTGAKFSVVDVLQASSVGALVDACPRQAAGQDDTDSSSCSSSDEESDSEESEDDEVVVMATALSAEKADSEVIRVVSKHASSNNSGDAITQETSIASLALDSLEVMAVVRDLNAATGACLSVVDVLQAGSLDELVAKARASSAMGSSKPQVSTPIAKSSPASMRKKTRSSASLNSQEERMSKLASKLSDVEAINIESGKSSYQQYFTTLREPSAAYRIYFTLLGYFIGTQVAFFGVLPCAWLERLVIPTRLALVPKLNLINTYVGLNIAKPICSLFPLQVESYPLPGKDYFKYNLRMDRLEYYAGGLHSISIIFRPTMSWTARFAFELMVTLVLYIGVWWLSSALAYVMTKWIIVGKQRPGTFPTWESSAGWRSALIKIVHDTSGGDIRAKFFERIAPDSWVSLYWRLLGAKVGKNVKYAYGLPSFIGADLVTVGDDVCFNSNVEMETVTFTTTCIMTHGHANIGRKCRIGPGAELRHGVHLGEGAVACIGAGARDYVPPGGFAMSGNVVRRAPEPTENQAPPTGALDTMVRTLQGPQETELQKLLPMLSIVTLLPLILWIAAFPLLHLLFQNPMISTGQFHAGYSCALLGTCLAAAACAPCCILLIACLIKFCCFGSRGLRQQKYELSGAALTRTFVLRYRLCAMWSSLAVDAFSRFFKFSGAMNTVWRALGMRIGAGAILSDIMASKGHAELMEVGTNVYLAANTFFITSRVDTPSGTVYFEPVRVGAGAFIGPVAILLPGAVVEAGAGVGAMAIVGRRVRIPTGRIAIGDASPQLTLAWRPKLIDAMQGRDVTWDVFSSLLLGLHAIFQTMWGTGLLLALLLATLIYTSSCFWSPSQIAIRNKELLHKHKADLSTAFLAWLAVTQALERSCFLSLVFVFARVLTQPLKALIHVAYRRSLLNISDDGVPMPLRGSTHLAWIVVFLAGSEPIMPDELRFLWEYVNFYGRCLGFTHGENFRYFPKPSRMQAHPESQMIHFGDNVQWSGITYGHDYSNMHLVFKRSHIGDNVRSLEADGLQVLPGSRLPASINFDICGRCLCWSGLVTEPGGTYAGNPARIQQPE